MCCSLAPVGYESHLRPSTVLLSHTCPDALPLDVPLGQKKGRSCGGCGPGGYTQEQKNSARALEGAANPGEEITAHEVFADRGVDATRVSARSDHIRRNCIEGILHIEIG